MAASKSTLLVHVIAMMALVCRYQSSSSGSVLGCVAEMLRERGMFHGWHDDDDDDDDDDAVKSGGTCTFALNVLLFGIHTTSCW